MNKKIFLPVLLMLCSCTITREVEPVSKIPQQQKEICILENPASKRNIKSVIETSLIKKGYNVRTVSSGELKECENFLTYTARWSWDMTTYLSYLEIEVFKNNEKTGRAFYKSGGMFNLRYFSKYVNAEDLTKELIDELFE